MAARRRDYPAHQGHGRRSSVKHRDAAPSVDAMPFRSAQAVGSQPMRGRCGLRLWIGSRRQPNITYIGRPAGPQTSSCCSRCALCRRRKPRHLCSMWRLLAQRKPRPKARYKLVSVHAIRCFAGSKCGSLSCQSLRQHCSNAVAWCSCGSRAIRFAWLAAMRPPQTPRQPRG